MLKNSIIKQIQQVIEQLNQTNSISFFNTNTKTLTACKHLLILDSSYNPPTIAHEQLVQVSLNHLLKTQTSVGLLLLLSNKNMDKINFTGASIEQRLHYMKLMHDKLIKQYQDKLIFSDIALTTSGKFIDKINVLSQVSRNKEMKYHFIMGYDTLIRVLDFKYYMKEYNYESMVETLKPFFLNGNIYYTKRGEEIVDKEMDKLLLRFKEKIVYFELLEKCHEEVSSTKVRQAIKDGDKEGKLKNMVDKDILKLVLEDNPYV